MEFAAARDPDDLIMPEHKQQLQGSPEKPEIFGKRLEEMRTHRVVAWNVSDNAAIDPEFVQSSNKMSSLQDLVSLYKSNRNPMKT